MNYNTQKKKGLFKAYEGKQPYIFVSYKHADSNVIHPILKEFNDVGFNIWYDDGLQYGEDYDDLIDLKIEESSLFLICITKTVINHALDSNEYMKKELDVAIDTETPILPVLIDDVKLKGKYRMQLKGKHSIFKSKYDDDKLFINECVNAFMDDFGLKPNNFRLTSPYLKEFDQLNKTTTSIFDLEGYKVLIVLKDGTNLTNWDYVKNKDEIIYVSEDLSDFTDLSRKYENLKNLKAIVATGVSGNIVNMKFMFHHCLSLVDISCLKKWDVSNVRNMSFMFHSCESLVDLSPLNDWDVSNVTEIDHMFPFCESLVDISGLKNWNVSNVTNMAGLFAYCHNLVDLSPLNDWDVSKVENMEGMFDDCSSLIDLSPLNDWDVSNVKNMKLIFDCCESETYLDWYQD